MATLSFFKTKLQIGDVLDELNERTRIYNKGLSMSIESAQKQSMRDFDRYMAEDVVPLEIADMPDEHTYFKRIEIVERQAA